uniref:40S ribosomal protein S30 n=1 Tax=Steinernema glaseri TaxID=37863 RepID=A0A1I7Y826_9BILA
MSYLRSLYCKGIEEKPVFTSNPQSTDTFSSVKSYLQSHCACPNVLSGKTKRSAARKRVSGTVRQFGVTLRKAVTTKVRRFGRATAFSIRLFGEHDEVGDTRDGVSQKHRETSCSSLTAMCPTCFYLN